MIFGRRGRLLSTMQPIPCDLRGLPADAAAVEALARLQLAARRAGCELCLWHASPELCSLIEFIGLGAVLGVEPRREAEEREERVGVEEEGQLPDPPV
jgi:hypothetical protein